MEERQVRRSLLRGQGGIHRPGFHSGPQICWVSLGKWLKLKCAHNNGAIQSIDTGHLQPRWVLTHVAASCSGIVVIADTGIERVSSLPQSRRCEFFNYSKTLFKMKLSNSHCRLRGWVSISPPRSHSSLRVHWSHVNHFDDFLMNGIKENLAQKEPFQLEIILKDSWKLYSLNTCHVPRS